MSNNDRLIKNRLNAEIASISIDKEELRNILDRLQVSANSACENEVRKIECSDASDEYKNAAIPNLRTCATLKITVRGKGREDFFGTIEEVFNSPSFPEHVTEMFVNSE